MSTHTPGPWKISDKRANGTKAYVEGAAGYVVAQSYCSPSVKITYNDLWAEAEANASLIAAAPELLELAFQYRNDLLHPPAPDSRERRIKAIDAAIAKIKSGEDNA